MTEFRMDGYTNRYTGFGAKRDSSEAYEYLPEAMIPDITLARHYETNGLFAKIIDAPAEEAIKHGFDLALNEPIYEQYIEDMLDILDWETKAATAIKWARLFGGAIIVMMIDDGGSLEDPVDWNNIRSIDELRVYERPIVQPDWVHLYDNAGHDGLHRRSKFGMPQYYQVSSIYGSFTVHESRCLVFRNGILPEYTMLAEYRFWGMPEYSRIRRALREVITTHSSGTKLMERMVQPIYKMKDLASKLSTPEGEDEVMRRLRLIDQSRSFLNSIVIDAEGEEYDFKTFQLSGIKDIFDAGCNILSAITNIPQTVFFGRSPAGENSTGDSDFENWYNFIDRIRKMMLRSNLMTVLDAAFRAGVANGDIEKVPDYKLTFDPLWSLSETEQAAIDQVKAATALTRAQTAQLYMDAQVIDPTEIRKGLASTDEFNIEELLDSQDEEPLDWGIESEDNVKNERRQKDGLCVKIVSETDGGPGSGRYPKGSGESQYSPQAYKQAIEGVKTSDGKVVKSLSQHVLERATQRDVRPKSIKNALVSPDYTYPGNIGNRTVYVKKGTHVVYDNNSGAVVTTIYKGKKGK